MPENPVPEGQTSLAQRGSAGLSEEMIPVPEGRPSSHAHSLADGMDFGQRKECFSSLPEPKNRKVESCLIKRKTLNRS
jgi:hypothetical protein